MGPIRYHGHRMTLANTMLWFCAIGSMLGLSAQAAPSLAVARPASKSALRVVACAMYGDLGRTSATRETPHRLASTPAARRLSFYSDGPITVMGPTGWECGARVAADGDIKLDLYPPGKPDYSRSRAPQGSALIEVDVVSTAHLPGAELVCSLFPWSSAARYDLSSGFHCIGPVGQTSRYDLPDVAIFEDPPGVKGSGVGSGGNLTSLGLVVYPRVSSVPTVKLAELSCTMPAAKQAACRAIEHEFLIRNP